MIYTPYIWPLLLATTMLAGIAIYVRRFRDVPAVQPFSTLMWLGMLWALLLAFEISTVSVPLKILLLNLRFPAIAFMTPTILILALEYVGQGPWLTRQRLALLLIEPIFISLVALGSNYHKVFQYNFQLDLSGPWPVLLSTKAPLYWFHVVYAVALEAGALWLLVRSFRVRTLHVRDTFFIILGTLIPVFTAALFNLGLTPIRGYDLAPATFVFTGVLYSWALLRFRIFSVAPVARSIVMENIDDLVIVLDTRGHIVDFNRAARAVCGLSPTRSIGATPDTLLPVWADLFQHDHDISARKEVMVGMGDKQCVYDLTISPIRDKRNRTLGRLFLLHDITEHKRIEEAEREQRTLAEALRDTAAVLTSTLDLNDVLDRIMEEVQRVVPGDAAAIYMIEGDLARAFRWYVHGQPEHRELEYLSLTIDATFNLRYMVATGEPLVIPDTRVESKWIWLPGAKWIASYAGAPLRVRGQVIGFVEVDSATTGFFTPRDAERLHAFADQAAIAISNAQLFDETRRHAEHMTTLNRIGLAITAGLDIDHVLRSLYEQCQAVVAADSFYVALYDAETGEIRFPLFRDRGQYFSMDSQNLQTRPGLTGHVIQTRQTLYLPDTLDPGTAAAFQIVRSGGTPTRSYVGVPLILRDVVFGVLSMQSYQPHAYNLDQVRLLETIATQAAVAIENARLYTEARKAKEAAEAANAELVVRNQELDAFAHTVAHDLKSPIGLILGHAELLAEAYADLPAKQVEDSARVIVRGAEKLDSIIEKLMLLAGVRKQEVTVAPLGMGDIVHEALQRLSHIVQEKEAQITWSDASAWPVALGYAPWVEEVWANYINNALKYGGKPPRVELGATFVSPAGDGDERRGQVRFWVRDNGRGLTLEQQGKLFAQFERLEQTGVAGHGLGLSIVRRIVEKLGGQVGVESRLGQGSTFYFTLPAIASTGDDLKQRDGG